MLNNTYIKTILCSFFLIAVVVPAHHSYAGATKTDISCDVEADHLSLEARGVQVVDLIAAIAKKCEIKVDMTEGIKKEVFIKLKEISIEKGLKRILSGLSHAMVFSGTSSPRLLSLTITHNGESFSEKTANHETKKSATGTAISGTEQRTSSAASSVEERMELKRKKATSFTPASKKTPHEMMEARKERAEKLKKTQGNKINKNKHSGFDRKKHRHENDAKSGTGSY